MQTYETKKIDGMGTTYSKTLILHKENPMFGRKIHIIIVDEKLGFGETLFRILENNLLQFGT